MGMNTAGQKLTQVQMLRVWITLAMSYIFIPVVLLACGWDLRWWQAWIYSVLICAAGMVGRAWAEQHHPGLMQERVSFEKAPNVKAWDKVLAPLMAIGVSFPLVIVAGLDHRFGWSPVFPAWLNIL